MATDDQRLIASEWIKHRSNARRGLCVAIGLAACLAIAASSGCRSGARVNYDDERVYPALVQADTIDVQVFRIGTKIKLTNTTARSLPAGTLWLNRWYSAEVRALEPGESLTMPLKRFEDRYGERFRAGGFFATLDPDVLVLAQLEAGGELLGLVVVENTIR